MTQSPASTPRYEPAPFYVLRHRKADELWIDSTGGFTNDLKEAHRLPSRKAAAVTAVFLLQQGVDTDIESFDEANVRTCALASKTT